MIARVHLALIGVLLAPVVARPDDWPGWMGPQRDGVYRETGIVNKVPPEGLPVKWRKPIHGGFAGPAVAAGRVFVHDFRRNDGAKVANSLKGGKVDGKERLLVLDERTGEQLWQHSYRCTYTVDYPYGPRCTPEIDGDRVYLLGSEGDLKCLQVEDGKVVWSRHLQRDFGAKVQMWGFASHPLIVDDLLYTMVGGDGQAVVAFDKSTGRTRWKALDARAGYAPPTIIEAGGRRQLIVFHATAVASLNPQDGSRYWDVPFRAAYDMSICRPMIEGKKMFITGNTGSIMVELAGDQPAVKELWRGKRGSSSIQAANATPLFVDGVIYGTDHQSGRLIAARGEDGKRLWETFEATKPGETRFVKEGTAFLTRIRDTDRYLVMSETGDLLMARLTADGYEDLGRMHVLEPTQFAKGHRVLWSHPAYANRTAYIRNDKEIVAVDLEK